MPQRFATQAELAQAIREGWHLSSDTINATAARLPIDDEIARANARIEGEVAARSAGSGKRPKSTIDNPQGEDAMQIKVIDWARSPDQLAIYPELEFLYHAANEGKRSRVAGAMLKRLGMIPGVLDLHLAVARGGWHGWWAELKFGKNAPTQYQLRFADFLRAQGHRVVILWDDAQLVINDLEDYLSGKISRKAAE